MCDTVAVVTSGGVLFGKNSDREPSEAQAVEHVPARAPGAGAQRCTDWEVPAAGRARAVFLSRPSWMWGAEMGVNEDGVAPVVGSTRVLGCVVTLGAGLYEAGHVTRTTPATRPPFVVGELNGMRTPRVDELVGILSAVGPAHVTTMALRRDRDDAGLVAAPVRGRGADGIVIA